MSQENLFSASSGGIQWPGDFLHFDQKTHMSFLQSNAVFSVKSASSKCK